MVSPQRVGQKRIYSLRDRARLYLVLRGKRFGFSLAEIRELLDLYDLGDRQRTQITATLTSCREKLSQLQERREELNEAIAELTAIIGKLNEMLVEFDKPEEASPARGGSPAGKASPAKGAPQTNGADQESDPA